MATSETVARPALPRLPPRQDHRIAQQPGFVLHTYPYRETSLIAEVFTRDHGRLSLLAKGAKRPHSALRSVLHTFQPLALGWTGKGELRTMTQAEWLGGLLPLGGDALLSGFYANELLLRFLAREDAHTRLFDHYTLTLTRLAHGEPLQHTLRAFERVLLMETGYGQAFDTTDSGRRPFEPASVYTFEPERGWRAPRNDDPTVWPQVSGQTLLDIAGDDYRNPRTAAQSRQLMRFLLHLYLGGQTLNTRQILIDLQKL
ncbi:DNA repair protein RecO [Chitinasiproducens palmae]|uniref:DNA repair protein RecO n=1 Tax=Chitinasiproducens palmae TaxID=1770053 RepID=A0A1H2PUV2_9BURK|nr:DNA repair protein RecO [Chitinasiproducens palmae]SDV50993.1 DNA replication and repair protein RecO [Chitinasiproducens palmae]